MNHDEPLLEMIRNSSASAHVATSPADRCHGAPSTQDAPNARGAGFGPAWEAPSAPPGGKPLGELDDLFGI